MSDPVPATQVETVTAVVVDAPAPAPAPAPVVAEAVLDFSDKSVLLKFVLKTIAEVEILSDRTDVDKAKFIVDEVKKVIRESTLSAEQKTELTTWCDVSLPYVVEAVKLAKAEVGKVALAGARKCCPSFFTKKA
jgi:hypothetical protein